MIALGRLIRMPTSSPMAHPGQGSTTTHARKPMAKRSQNAPSSAVRLSGKDIGNISRMSMRPNARPQTSPSKIRDIQPPLISLLPEIAEQHHVDSLDAMEHAEFFAIGRVGKSCHVIVGLGQRGDL